MDFSAVHEERVFLHRVFLRVDLKMGLDKMFQRHFEYHGDEYTVGDSFLPGSRFSVITSPEIMECQQHPTDISRTSKRNARSATGAKSAPFPHMLNILSRS